MIWIAVAVGLSVVAISLRSRLPIALGLCAVPPLGVLLAMAFC